jgi:ABC-type transporter Mla subunit MlaD
MNNWVILLSIVAAVAVSVLYYLSGKPPKGGGKPPKGTVKMDVTYRGGMAA